MFDMVVLSVMGRGLSHSIREALQREARELLRQNPRRRYDFINDFCAGYVETEHRQANFGFFSGIVVYASFKTPRQKKETKVGFLVNPILAELELDDIENSYWISGGVDESQGAHLN